LLRVLAPDYLNGQKLVVFLAVGGESYMPLTLREIVNRLSLSDIEETLRALHSDLTSGIINHETQAKFRVAIPLLQAEIRNASNLTSFVAEILIAVERFHEPQLFFRSEDTLRLAFRANAETRRAFWAARFQQEDLNFMQCPFSNLEVEDLEWLSE